MVILHYGSNWGLYFVMTAAPKFVSSALGFNLTSTGTLSSLPYLARMIFSLIFGAIGDRYGTCSYKILNLQSNDSVQAYVILKLFFCQSTASQRAPTQHNNVNPALYQYVYR